MYAILPNWLPGKQTWQNEHPTGPAPVWNLAMWVQSWSRKRKFLSAEQVAKGQRTMQSLCPGFPATTAKENW
jgi:hypothetical protein